MTGRPTSGRTTYTLGTARNGEWSLTHPADCSYRVELITNERGSPRLQLTWAKVSANPEEWEEHEDLAADVDPRKVHWTEDGLAITFQRDEDNLAGLLCPAEVFGWRTRDKPLAPAYLEDEEEKVSPRRSPAKSPAKSPTKSSAKSPVRSPAKSPIKDNKMDIDEKEGVAA